MQPTLVTDILKNGINSVKPNTAWQNSINVFIDDESTRIELPGYTQYMLEGRRPGKMPPFDAIREWLKAKGMAENLYYPIAKKIAEQGTEGTGRTWFDNAVLEVREGTARELMDQFKNNFKK